MNGKLIAEGNKDTKLPHLTLTVKQLADRIQVSIPTAYAMTEQQDFPVFRIGKKKLIPLAALERWLDGQVCDGDPQQKASGQCRSS